MHRRRVHDTKELADKNALNARVLRVQQHPIQKVFSVLPPLTISLAILFYAIYTTHEPLIQSGITTFISFSSLAVLALIFAYLQVNGASYTHWKDNDNTRQCIQVATLAALVSVVGLHVSLWRAFGWLTSVVVIAGYVFLFNLLYLFTLFLSPANA